MLLFSGRVKLRNGLVNGIVVYFEAPPVSIGTYLTP